jgi:hypothetical protein
VTGMITATFGAGVEFVNAASVSIPPTHDYSDETLF